jgi:nucleotide-binding universal stress UspA family protein
MRILPRPRAHAQGGPLRCPQPTRRGRRAPIVVGVDGLASGRAALDWAAAEADTQNRPLHLVHAFTSALVVNPLGVASVPCDDASALAAAESVAQDAARRARDVASDLEVTTRVVVGPAATAVLHAAQDAEMVVLGRRGLGCFTSLLRRSVSVQVAARAPCPVTVVRPIHDVEPGSSSTQVVVGIDGSEHSARVIACAFEAASRRGLGLAAVHAWMPRCPADHMAIVDDLAATESAAWQKLEEALAGWRDRYAGVTVTPKLMRCPPGPALVAESAGAALVVVGSRGRGSLRGLLLGSVSQIVLQHAHCPLTVVRARP